MMGERRLIRRIRAGDQDACRELVQSHYAPIYQMLAALVRDQHAAEDLCQEAFAAAWKAIGSFNEKSSLRTWLHAIAYRKFLDSKRRLPVELEKTNTASVLDPLDGLVMDEDQRALYAAIDRLDERDRDVITLHYLQQMTYVEMSVVLAEPVGTVKWRTKVALENLRKSVTDDARRDEQVGETAAGSA
jgi:RNA polymerase sigma-70 factor (ECF subfamily)